MTTTTTTATKPSDYKHIAAWGRELGSFQYCITGITGQQERACAAGAPINAIYEKHAPDGSGATGQWATADEIKNVETRERIERAVEVMKARK